MNNFQRIKAKIKGFIDNPQQVLRDFKISDKNVPSVTEELLLCHTDWGKLAGGYGSFGWTLKNFQMILSFWNSKGQISFEAGKILLAITYFRQGL